MKPLIIPPNRPVTVALLDTEGDFDFEVGIGRYQTTTGQLLTLPRAAVVILNALEPRPGEEIVIQKVWSGKPGEPSEWTIRLSTQSEQARAEAGEADTLTEQLERSIEAMEQRKEAVAPPTPICRPQKRQPAAEVQPRLFDRGTGTHGPAPAVQLAPMVLPTAAIGRQPRPGQIPANVAVKEILEFIKADPSTANWGDQAVQDLLSTVFIGFVKGGLIGLWERPLK